MFRRGNAHPGKQRLVNAIYGGLLKAGKDNLVGRKAGNQRPKVMYGGDSMRKKGIGVAVP